jgi:YebC/PmpR family DNA-binding regulatory protein
MSGHSKWHNIRVKKMASDARRGKVYTRHAKLIQMAAQKGGDPAMNPSLRTAIENARAEGVPKENIERAVKKGTGELKGEEMQEILYAAYGPGGTAYLIECLTDNRNRTLSDLKVIIGKHGGNFAETPSVQWMFERKGLVVAKQSTAQQWKEENELQLIDAGAEDIDRTGDTIAVTSDMASWPKVRACLQELGLEVASAGLEYAPTQKVDVQDPGAAQKILTFVEMIEANDDVTAVHTNAVLPSDFTT